MKKEELIVNCSILVFSFILIFVVIEVALRFFCPQYMYAANSKFNISPYRIFSRVPNTAGFVTHPDTGQKLLFIINELGQHQHRHRNLSSLDNNNVIKIGIFGDSFTENMRIKSQYSFVEILDYLLNSNTKKIEVYNFGVEGYGTDQSYAYYRDSPLAAKMDYVLYLFCSNDIRNNFENRLFSFDSQGNLTSLGAHRYSFLKQLAANLYITYFLEDTYYKLSVKYNFTIGSLTAKLVNCFNIKKIIGYNNEIINSNNNGLQMERDLLNSRETKATIYAKKLFYAILSKWRDLTSAHNAKFIIASLPRPNEHKLRRLFVNEEHFVDLWHQFYADPKSTMSTGDWQKLYNPWRFKNNDHWNEAGNLKAAIILYKYFVKTLNLNIQGDKWLNKKIYEYYSAFPGGWLPYGTGLVQPVKVSDINSQKIRKYYTELNKEYEN